MDFLDLRQQGGTSTVVLLTLRTSTRVTFFCPQEAYKVTLNVQAEQMKMFTKQHLCDKKKHLCDIKSEYEHISLQANTDVVFCLGKGFRKSLWTIPSTTAAVYAVKILFQK